MQNPRDKLAKLSWLFRVGASVVQPSLSFIRCKRALCLLLTSDVSRRITAVWNWSVAGHILPFSSNGRLEVITQRFHQTEI